MELNLLNTAENIREIKPGMLLVIERKRDNRRILVRCKSVINNEEILFSGSKNDYFIWDMYLKGKSWVWRVWTLPDVDITNITNNKNEFPRC